MKYLTFFFLILLATETQSQTQAHEFLLYCKQSQILGLDEQCQEVLIRGQAGDHLIRVYSRASNRELTLPLGVLFIGKPMNHSDRVSDRQIVAVRSTDLGNSSSAGFLSLCQASAVSKNEMLGITCGRFQNETLLKSRVLKLAPYKKQNSLKLH